MPHSSRDSLSLRLQAVLEKRREEGSFRSLVHFESLKTETLQDDIAHYLETMHETAIDFSSNDYLGLARCQQQLSYVMQTFDEYVQLITKKSLSVPHSPTFAFLGATGSRLLSGNSLLPRIIESWLSRIHNRPAALLFNSGYDANLSILSSIPIEGDVVICDSLVHNSLIMGIKMGRVTKEDVYFFRHNNIQDLRNILNAVKVKMCFSESACVLTRSPEIFIIIESVYSMDGDIPPLAQILDLALKYNAKVIVDEAHALGVYGRTNIGDLILPEDQQNHRLSASVESHAQNDLYGGTGVLAALKLESHPALLASIHTFGKAAGCHGAVIASSVIVVDYLVNYARPFIYSTCLPPHSLLTIACSYTSMTGNIGEDRRKRVFSLVSLFRLILIDSIRRNCNHDFVFSSILLPSPSPIQAVLCPGNKRCILWSQELRLKGHHVYPIRFPTVPRGSERIRIIIHYHNTEQEVSDLALHLTKLITVPSLSNNMSKL